MTEKKTTQIDRWANALLKARQSQTLKALIEAKDAPQRIAQAPTPELYFAIQEAGLADASEVLEHITGEQLQGFIDLGAWRGDRFDLETTAEWLGALAEASKEKFKELLSQVDEEWVVIFLRRYVSVYDSPDEVPEPLEEGAIIRSSPDMQNTLVIRDAQDNGALAALMLEGFFAKDVMYGRRMMEASRAELDAELEEEALRFRNGRLADLGFLPREEAIEVYYPKEDEKILAEARKREKAPPTIDVELLRHTGLPSPFLEPMEEKGPLAERLSASGAEEVARRFMLELPSLLNRVLAANSADPADVERISQLTRHARGVLDIAAKRVSNEDLGRLTLQEMFRIGWWQIASLRPRAQKLLQEDLFGVLPERDRLAVKSLSAPIPTYSLALSRPPGEGSREFYSDEERKIALSALEHAEVSLWLLSLMKITQESLRALRREHKGAAELNVESLFNTALANALLGREFSPNALTVKDLPTLQERLFTQGEINREVTRSAQETLASVPTHLTDAAQRAVSLWLASLVGELSRLSVSPLPEARFVGGVLLR